MRFDDALRGLDARQPEHMPGPSLDRIRKMVNYLDHPELTYPTIHVTGTNGKTTAARAAAVVACAHGVNTGLYTSPHLTSVTERFSVCGVDMSEQEFGEEWARLAPYLELVDAAGHGEVTYFEAITALAFLWFADKPVSLGVFEVGMGGSWDATNLVTGDVAVVCPIGMDHVAQLGPTLGDIATEKAGIVKEGKVAIVREQEPDAEQVLRTHAEEVEALLSWEGPDWEVEYRAMAVGGQAFTLRGLHRTYEELFVPMFGSFAVHNVAAGVVAFEAFTGQALDEDALREGLADLRSPGRLEIVGRSPLVILDGAHNPAGSEALAEAMREFFTWNRLHLVIAISGDKDVAAMTAPLAPLADVVHATRNDSVRSADAQVVADAFAAQGAEIHTVGSVVEALEAARSHAAPEDVILVTGSLYTVADARRALGVV
jgi:dihydrofolate synthase / folylpolyglutamate synthase